MGGYQVANVLIRLLASQYGTRLKRGKTGLKNFPGGTDRLQKHTTQGWLQNGWSIK